MKKTIIAAGIALMSALSLTACGKVTVSEVENGEITSSSEMQIDDIEEYYKAMSDADSSTGTDTNTSTYMPIENETRKPVLADANGYESSNGYTESTYYVSINDNIKNVFGLTYPQIDGLTNYAGCSLYTLDAVPGLYGVEYQNSINGIYLMQKTGTDPFGSDDTCIGAFGWFSRIMDFEHEYRANLSDLENSLKAMYPDCTTAQFTDRSVIPNAPTNISYTLAYFDFTASFNNVPDTKVRLYVEVYEYGYDSSVSSDTWCILCRQGTY